ncbi:hypothetical protein J2Y45_002130 [Dyadobacter sp. BE34]|uniref:Uncharacterized protein n=1 Tax=Dyadobacter fermentans TaxID=94254 RepID=A0ABU1QWQ6_9BACT|nr:MULTISPECIES: hypothetical protein [Dyadobacter]MBO9612537.1 hypothetical protein [Dyadobacter sp.]MDR6805561.1 hypothetical protein [Dyadobacter fermentans]MDR7042679.1 hypothetical protein [Dyadobacter sp. BE242]MDR7196991.1 hypothetical protein [Dyadobacter sp. BE34]MDR7215574.1 hypothetical protein [Dyadobacter sp. BE31]
MKIQKTDLQLTKTAFFKLFNDHLATGTTVRRAFDHVDRICWTDGYKNYYSSFESFKAAYYGNKAK